MSLVKNVIEWGIPFDEYHAIGKSLNKIHHGEGNFFGNVDTLTQEYVKSLPGTWATAGVLRAKFPHIGNQVIKAAKMYSKPFEGAIKAAHKVAPTKWKTPFSTPDFTSAMGFTSKVAPKQPASIQKYSAMKPIVIGAAIVAGDHYLGKAINKDSVTKKYHTISDLVKHQWSGLKKGKFISTTFQIYKKQAKNYFQAGKHAAEWATKAIF